MRCHCGREMPQEAYANFLDWMLETGLYRPEEEPPDVELVYCSVCSPDKTEGFIMALPE